MSDEEVTENPVADPVDVVAGLLTRCVHSVDLALRRERYSAKRKRSMSPEARGNCPTKVKSPDGQHNSFLAELALWNWILQQNIIGLAPSSEMLCEKYTLMLRMQGPITGKQELQLISLSKSKMAAAQ